MYNRVKSGSPTKVVNIRLPDYTRLNTTAKLAATVTAYNNRVIIDLYELSGMRRFRCTNFYRQRGRLSVARNSVNAAFQTLLAQYPGLMQTTPAPVA